MFGEKQSWSCFDEDGKLREPPGLSSQLKLDGGELPHSNLVILLRALAPIRGQANITIETPDDIPMFDLDR